MTTVAAIRALPVTAPDAHSVTRFAPFVSMPPEWRDALADIADAAHALARVDTWWLDELGEERMDALLAALAKLGIDPGQPVEP